jgi:transposase
MVKQYEEDELNRKYMEESTTGCPHCGVRCEKSHGEIVPLISLFTSLNGECSFQDVTM